MKNQIVEIAKELSMIYSVRHVNIRGYVREVTVLSCKANKDDEWKVVCNGKIEYVPSHLFYHETPGGLILRDSLEFKRMFGDHHIGIVQCPTYYGC